MTSGNVAAGICSRRGGIDQKINGDTAFAETLGREGTDVIIGGGILHNSFGLFDELEWNAPWEPCCEKTNDPIGDGMDEWIEAVFISHLFEALKAEKNWALTK